MSGDAAGYVYAYILEATYRAIASPGAAKLLEDPHLRSPSSLIPRASTRMTTTSRRATAKTYRLPAVHNQTWHVRYQEVAGSLNCGLGRRVEPTPSLVLRRQDFLDIRPSLPPCRTSLKPPFQDINVGT